MTELRHYDDLNTVRFITFSCHNRMKLLIDDNAKLIFVKALDKLRMKYSFKLYAYVVMPNHVHLLIYPCEGTLIGRVIGELKSLSAREILNYFRTTSNRILKELKVIRRNEERFVFWQKRCFDHNCRDHDSIITKIEYCHKNPVTRGLAAKPEDWTWSSYSHYFGARNGIIDIDLFDMNSPTAIAHKNSEPFLHWNSEHASGGAPYKDDNERPPTASGGAPYKDDNERPPTASGGAPYKDDDERPPTAGGGAPFQNDIINA